MRAKADDKGILLGDYIKLYEQPETYVRGQLDRGEILKVCREENRCQFYFPEGNRCHTLWPAATYRSDCCPGA